MRAGLAALAAVELVLGLWTVSFPRSFYDTVPTVALDPPFNEHLFRDFGGASLGLALVLSAAAVYLERRLVRIALSAYLLFAVPHLIFHVTHLDDFTRAQAVLLSSALALSVAFPVVLLTLTRRLSAAGVAR
ncbi:hypothetical protein [Actinokineospora sp.]|uniref:hypothetical protein n=1 Tax=Actinokineospora sp. TaxID=1872133 RepID=UPI0040384014